jgi:hypothetical protein
MLSPKRSHAIRGICDEALIRMDADRQPQIPFVAIQFAGLVSDSMDGKDAFELEGSFHRQISGKVRIDQVFTSGVLRSIGHMIGLF